MRLKAFKFRLYPNKSQQAQLNQAFGCSRFVYNWGLELRTKAYQKNKKLNFFTTANQLPKLKKDNPWLKEAYSQCLQASLKHLDMAFTNFFKKRADYPKFKSRNRSKPSISIPQNFKIDEKTNSIIIPKVGKIKAVIHRKLEGEPKSITISMSRSGKYYVSLLVETSEKDLPTKAIKAEKTIGIDLGLKSFLVDSNGNVVENPKFLRKSLKKLKSLQKKHSKKKKGGKNRERARLRLAKQHEKVHNKKMDFLHKVTTKLARENQSGTICIEDLNVSGMLKNHKLAGAIQDVSWFEFKRLLEYKCKWNGVNLVKIGRFEPSSRLCPCGFRNKDLKLNDREWECPECHEKHDRDILAARNIKTFGLAQVKKCGRTSRIKLGELPISSLGATNQEAPPL